MNNDEWDEDLYEYMERLESEYDAELQEEEHINELNERIVQLEKALDKACEGLAENCYLDDTTQKIKDAYYFSKVDCVPLSAEEWKAWCLQDE